MLKLKEARKKSGYKQAEIAKMLGVTQAAYSSWETGRTSISNDNLKKLADIFGVSIDFLIGGKKHGENWTAVPVLGHVLAGLPNINTAEVLDKEYIPPKMAMTGEYFALKIKGNSMSPRIQEGDVVIIRRQTLCDSGDIAVVEVDGGNYTVKKINLISGGIMLVPLNTAYDPIFYSFEMMKKYNLRIVGKVVELRCRL